MGLSVLRIADPQRRDRLLLLICTSRWDYLYCKISMVWLRPNAPLGILIGTPAFLIWAEGRCALRPRMLRFPSSRHTSPVSLARTHDTRTAHAVDVTGGGRNSEIIRRISANRFRGIATSTIWKAT